MNELEEAKKKVREALRAYNQVLRDHPELKDSEIELEVFDALTRSSPNSRKTLQLADEESTELRWEERRLVGTEHILLALLNGKGFAREYLESCGIGYYVVKRHFEESYNRVREKEGWGKDKKTGTD